MLGEKYSAVGACRERSTVQKARAKEKHNARVNVQRGKYGAGVNVLGEKYSARVHVQRIEVQNTRAREVINSFNTSGMEQD